MQAQLHTREQRLKIQDISMRMVCRGASALTVAIMSPASCVTATKAPSPLLPPPLAQGPDSRNRLQDHHLSRPRRLPKAGAGADAVAAKMEAGERAQAAVLACRRWACLLVHSTVQYGYELTNAAQVATPDRSLLTCLTVRTAFRLQARISAPAEAFGSAALRLVGHRGATDTSSTPESEPQHHAVVLP